MVLLEKTINWFLTNSTKITQVLIFKNTLSERRNSTEYGPSRDVVKLDFNE
jgi:hypothetical protein